MTPAGLLVTRKNRKTKLMISVYDGVPAGLDVAAGRWQTVCESHGNILSSTTRQLAISAMSHPDWCECCAVMIENPTLRS